MTALNAIPTSCVSWTFDVYERRSLVATLSPRSWFGESVSLDVDGDACLIEHGGMLSGTWTLWRGDETLAVAHKRSAFVRGYELEVAGSKRQLRLEPRSPFTRAFRLTGGNRELGWIRPEHPFTRRAILDLPDELPRPVQLFAFGLVVISWRRSARSNNGAS